MSTMFDIPAMPDSPIDRFGVFVVGAPGLIDADVAALVPQLRGTLVGEAAPADAVAVLADGAHDLVVVADLTASAEVSAPLLEALDAVVDERHRALVLSLTPAQLDLADAVIVRSKTELLCAPSTADWLAAIVTASQAGRPLSDTRGWGESEAARLARLNAEVARIAEVLTRLSRREEDGGDAHARERPPSFAGAVPTFDITALEVRDVIRARRLRDRFFGAGLLEDPAWDMLLDLFAAHLERAQVSVSSLCIAAAVAPTTALRWIRRLTEAGLLERDADPFDRRRAFVRLSLAALEGMSRYVAAIREAGVPLV